MDKFGKETMTSGIVIAIGTKIWTKVNFALALAMKTWHVRVNSRNIGQR